jgi:exonuclease SbcC
MKILKIKFENIHSLKGEHEIDFGAGILADAGLFAITGPTGSGKSTLLDVITLALFNRIARVEKVVSNTVLEDDGGIMTRNMKHCYAEVEYRVNGKDYRSHWSIERNRNNNLNPRKQELVEVASGYILESGTKTPEKNHEIIGLSYDQFIKAMVLSQGEFSKLLQAPRNERNKLLEDITGAKSYREIGKAVFLRYRGILKDIEIKEANLEGIELLTSEAIAEKKKELEVLNKSKPQIEKTFQIAADKIKIREDLQAKEKDWKALEGEKEKLKDDFKIFKPYKTELEKHEKFSKYTHILRDFDTSLKELNTLSAEAKQLLNSKTDAETQQKSYLDAITTLIKEKVDIKNARDKVEVFRDKIVTLQAEEKKKLSEANLFQNQINKYVVNINQLGYKLAKADKPELFKPQFDSFQKSVQQSIENSGMKSLDELSAALEIKRAMHEKAGDLLSKKEQSIKIHSNIEVQKSKLKNAKESFAEDSRTIESLRGEIEKLSNDVEILEKNLEHQRRHQSLEKYREQLVPDEPCPLCGSLEHPYASEEPYFDSQEELLKEKKESLKTKSQLSIALNAKNKFQTDSIISLQAEIKTITEEEIQNREILTAIAADLKWNHEESLEILLTKRTELSRFIQRLEKYKREFQVQSILKDMDTNFEHWKNTSMAYNSLKEERMELYEGDSINEKANMLSSRVTQSIANLSSIEKQILQNSDKLKSISAENLKKERELKDVVIKEGLENIEALRSAIISEERAAKIRKRENELRELQTRISEKENVLDKVLKELRAADDTEGALEQLILLHGESKKQWDELSINIGKITNSLEKNDEDRKRHQKVLDEINLMKKDLALWKSMNDLIGDATGNKFSNFVQDLTLEQLIGFANKRLSDFSDRYLLDIPTPEEADKSDTLKIFDNYMGNARRSVETLSGGETFLVSLAMAFALSDIAARNVKIESLFIDEGFGTLDPETLDQAITILEKMQNEGNKSVGIISHVSALKERITTQIKLDKGSLGYSTLEVVQ